MILILIIIEVSCDHCRARVSFVRQPSERGEGIFLGLFSVLC